jgi:hypothetical protein
VPPAGSASPGVATIAAVRAVPRTAHPWSGGGGWGRDGLGGRQVGRVVWRAPGQARASPTAAAASIVPARQSATTRTPRPLATWQMPKGGAAPDERELRRLALAVRMYQEGRPHWELPAGERHSRVWEWVWCAAEWALWMLLLLWDLLSRGTPLPERAPPPPSPPRPTPPPPLPLHPSCAATLSYAGRTCSVSPVVAPRDAAPPHRVPGPPARTRDAYHASCPRAVRSSA